MAGLDEDEHSDICSRCKITESKKWYGRKGDRRFCNGAKCRQASREYYNAAAAEAPVLITPVVGRKRVAPEDEEHWDTSVVTDPSLISRVYSCLGIRCALPCPTLASAARLQLCIAQPAPDPTHHRLLS